MISCLTLNRAPYAAVKWYQGELDDGREVVHEDVTDVVQSEIYKPFQNTTFYVGVVLILFYLQYGLSALARFLANNRLPCFWNLLMTSSERAEARLKLSGMRKLNDLLVNAYQLHPDASNAEESNSKRWTRSFASASIEAEDPTMRNYVLRGERFESCGGLLWTWLNLFNGTLFSYEGIWINTRMIVMQVAQVIVALIVSVFGIVAVEQVADEAEKAREELSPTTPKWAADLIPTREMVYRSMYPAALTATAVMILLIGVYIPR